MILTCNSAVASLMLSRFIKYYITRVPSIVKISVWFFGFWYLTPLSAIFQLYHGDQF